MFLLWRLAKLVFRLAFAVALIVAGFVAWALLWPVPHVRPERCPSNLRGCVVASGRVAYHTAFGPHRHAHLVLISSRSITLPGVVTAELPGQLLRAPDGLGFGDWVSIAGVEKIGSHGERDVHVLWLATAAVRIRCGRRSGRPLCEVRRDGRRAR
ncbi:MAG TPA: hypothetical protein VKV21_18375 [Solirubrobacteraceae bacterium]|nr:hypothetical protein [Solirubrobacteraceae bacterium]